MESVRPDVLEEAWQSFLCADVAVAAVLAGEGQRSARELDVTVAAALDADGRWAAALAARVEALALAARWHVLEAGRLVGNIGHDLLRLGRLDEARSWYERALAWDPASPFIVRGLAETHLARGELAHAFAYREYLDRAGYRPEHAFDFDTDVACRGLDRPPPGPACRSYLPDLGSLFALDEAGFARQCAVFQFEGGGGSAPAEVLRAHALACLMRGRADHAYWVASLAAAAPAGDGTRGALERVWSRAVRDAMHVRLAPAGIPAQVELRMGTLFTPPEQPHDGEPAAAARLATVDELAARGDHATLAAMLHDPHPVLRLAAAAALTVAGDARARVFVEELAACERACGVDTWRPEMAFTATRLRWFAERRIALAGKPPRVIPEDGIENPGLAGFDPGQVMSVMLTFLDELDDARMARIQTAAAAVLEGADWPSLGGEPRLAVERDEVSLHLALVKPPAPRSRKPRPGDPTGGDIRPVLRDLLAAISSVQPFAEVMLARFDLPAAGGHFLQPVNDPRDDGTDPAADGDDEASEPEGGLFMLFPIPDGQVPERRNARLWLRDLRIIYGLPDVEHRAPDPRSAEVAAALGAALRHGFRGLPPTFRDRHGRTGAVDPIELDGRRGHAVAIDGMDPRFLVHYPATSRFREYELFQAVRELCGAVGLRPVVHWYREGGLYVLNCWEW